MKISFSVTGSTSTEAAPRALASAATSSASALHEHREHAAGARAATTPPEAKRDLRRLARRIRSARVGNSRADRRAAQSRSVRPRSTIATWSATCSISASWCVDSSAVTPSRATRPTSSLEKLFGRDGIEPGGRLVEDHELRARAEREQPRELRAHSARQVLHGSVGRQLELAQILGREIRAPTRINTRKRTRRSPPRTSTSRDRGPRSRTTCGAESRDSAPGRRPRGRAP